MPKSYIFDEYAKQMINEGFVKEAKEESKKTSIDDLMDLYNILPNGEEDKVHLMEKAHPETAVIGRAYDAMNAVVENNLQRHDIMTWIALKVPDGHLTHQRYVKSKSDLMTSLVQAGFTMDANGEEDIMKLADSCSQTLNKTAAWPVAIPLVIAGMGLLYWVGYGDVAVQNVHANARLLLDELKDVSDKPYVPFIQKAANKLMTDAIEFNNIKSRMITNSLDEFVGKAAEAQTQNDMAKLEQINSVWDKFLQVYPAFEQAVKFSMEQSSDEGSSDWWKKLKDIGKTIIPALDDEKQILDYLKGLQQAVLEAKQQAQQLRSNGLQNAMKMQDKIKESIDVRTKQPEGKEQSWFEDLTKELEDQIPQ